MLCPNCTADILWLQWRQMCSGTRLTLRNDAVTMLFVLLCLQAAARVLSEAPLLPPQNIHVDKGQLTWTPPTEERGVTYSVQYRSFNFPEWKDVPDCIQISFNSCNITFIKAEAEFGCVMLRVQAERRQLTSIPAEACSSRHGDTCTPDFRLTAHPGSLTIHLSRNHSLAQEYADHAKYRVYFGKEGQPLREYDDPTASVSISDLEGGQRYCAKITYITYHQPVGLPSCIQCAVIPLSRESKGTVISVTVVVVVILLMIPVVAYVLIFKRGKIKQWLRPPYKMPDLLKSFPEQHISILPGSPDEELCDVVSSITPVEVSRE